LSSDVTTQVPLLGMNACARPQPSKVAAASIFLNMSPSLLVNGEVCEGFHREWIFNESRQLRKISWKIPRALADW
jgi:hypothetical protein